MASLAQACPMSSADAGVLQELPWWVPYRSDADGLAGALKKFEKFRRLEHRCMRIRDVCWVGCQIALNTTGTKYSSAPWSVVSQFPRGYRKKIFQCPALCGRGPRSVHFRGATGTKYSSAPRSLHFGWTTDH